MSHLRKPVPASGFASVHTARGVGRDLLTSGEVFSKWILGESPVNKRGYRRPFRVGAGRSAGPLTPSAVVPEPDHLGSFPGLQFLRFSLLICDRGWGMGPDSSEFSKESSQGEESNLAHGGCLCWGRGVLYMLVLGEGALSSPLSK